MSPRSQEYRTKAHERLSAARDVLAAGHPEACVTMAYYAGLHAARAALSEHDLNARSHSGLWHLLRQNVTASGEIADDLVVPLQRAQKLREGVDYNLRDVSDEEARALLGAAERLIAAVDEAYRGR